MKIAQNPIKKDMFRTALLVIFFTSLSFAYKDLGQKELSDGFSSGGKISVSTITMADAQKLMQAFKADTKIPFDYGIDGCNQRAVIMTEIAHKLKIETGKVFAQGKLYVDNSNSKLKPKFPDDVYGWTNHVAPVVYVQDKNQTVAMILDPSMADQPMTMDEFKKKLSYKGTDSWPNGKKKEDPQIDRIYYGSRFQDRSYEAYPSKMPARDMSEAVADSYNRLKSVDYMATPGSGWLNISRDEYCEKYGGYCTDAMKEKGVAVQKKLQTEKEHYESQKPYQRCDTEDIKEKSKNTATLPDGFTNSGRIEANILSEDEARSLMAAFKNSKEIPFKDSDNCHLRAHYMLELARQKGIELSKVFFEGELRAKKPGTTGQNKWQDFNAWNMHVAPVAVVRGKDGKLRKLVLDPSLVDEPMELSTYKNKLLEPSENARRPIKIEKMYCSDRFQLQAQKDYRNKLPPHDMSQITKQAKETFQLVQTKFGGDVGNAIKGGVGR